MDEGLTKMYAHIYDEVLVNAILEATKNNVESEVIAFKALSTIQQMFVEAEYYMNKDLYDKAMFLLNTLRESYLLEKAG
jgi:hypothetical protein